MTISVRGTHHTFSYVMFLVLAFMAMTGGIWAACYRSLGYEKAAIKWLIRFHQGDVLDIDSTGFYIKAPFCVAVMVGTCVMVFTGLYQFSLQSMLKNRSRPRMYHQWFALFAALPLLIMAVTGGIWAVAKYVLLMKKEDIKWLILLHQGINTIINACYHIQ
jgi:hypothetical protein